MKTNLWKRFIALALSCLLSIALLAGCGGQNASDEKSSSAGSQVQDSANTSENIQNISPDSQASSAEETDFVHSPRLACLTFIP